MSGDSKGFKFNPENSILGGLRERLNYLESRIIDTCSLDLITEVNKVINGRLEKLEQKPKGGFIGDPISYDFRMRLEKLEKLCTPEEPEKSKPKTAISLIEEFLDYQSHGGIKEAWVKANLDIFIRWLYERGYEIRDKKK